MGCLQYSPQSYFDLKNTEENEIRKWESQLGFFQIDLSIILSNTMCHSRVYKKKHLEEVASKMYNNSFLQLMQNDYFKDGNNYDSYMINLLFFLTSGQSILVSKSNTYSDKASMMYLFIKSNEEDELNTIFEKNNKNLKHFVDNLCRIACIVEAETYMKVNNITREGFINNMGTYVQDISNYIINDLFLDESKQPYDGGIAFEDLNKKFLNDEFVIF